MHPYIPHLIEDIENAHRTANGDPPKDSELSFEEQMEEVENWATGSKTPPTLSQETGLTAEQFPPSAMLTELEMTMVIDAFQQMLSSWNMHAEFPADLPVSCAYSLLNTLLEEEAWYLPGGTMHFDFCTGYAPECELKEHCPCLEHWKEKQNVS